MFTSRACMAAATAKIRALKGRTLLPTRAALTLTPTAVRRVKELTAGVPDCIGLRIGVKQRGCNGLSYTLDYAQSKQKFDEVVDQDGVSIYIDKKAQLSILGKTNNTFTIAYHYNLPIFSHCQLFLFSQQPIRHRQRD